MSDVSRSIEITQAERDWHAKMGAHFRLLATQYAKTAVLGDGYREQAEMHESIVARFDAATPTPHPDTGDVTPWGARVLPPPAHYPDHPPFDDTRRHFDHAHPGQAGHGGCVMAAGTMPACAWCGKPGKVFVAGNPHCGGSHAAMAEPTIPVPMTLREALRDALTIWHTPGARLYELNAPMEAVRRALDEMPRGWHVAHEAITDLCARYDAAAARPTEPEREKDKLDAVVDALATGGASLFRPAEPERTVRWCETHGPTGGQPVVDCTLDRGHCWATHCRVTTRSVGGEVEM